MQSGLMIGMCKGLFIRKDPYYKGEISDIPSVASCVKGDVVKVITGSATGASNRFVKVITKDGKLGYVNIAYLRDFVVKDN